MNIKSNFCVHLKNNLLKDIFVPGTLRRRQDSDLLPRGPVTVRHPLHSVLHEVPRHELRGGLPVRQVQAAHHTPQHGLRQPTEGVRTETED